MSVQYIITTVVSILDRKRTIEAARKVDPEVADQIDSLPEALEALYSPNVPPLDNGFETVSCTVLKAANPRAAG